MGEKLKCIKPILHVSFPDLTRGKGNQAVSLQEDGRSLLDHKTNGKATSCDGSLFLAQPSGALTLGQGYTRVVIMTAMPGS